MVFEHIDQALYFMQEEPISFDIVETNAVTIPMLVKLPRDIIRIIVYYVDQIKQHYRKAMTICQLKRNKQMLNSISFEGFTNSSILADPCPILIRYWSNLEYDSREALFFATRYIGVTEEIDTLIDYTRCVDLRFKMNPKILLKHFCEPGLEYFEWMYCVISENNKIQPILNPDKFIRQISKTYHDSQIICKLSIGTYILYSIRNYPIFKHSVTKNEFQLPILSGRIVLKLRMDLFENLLIQIDPLIELSGKYSDHLQTYQINNDTFIKASKFLLFLQKCKNTFIRA